MDKGIVSIITPTYNCEKFILDTIKCVISQTYTNWEMIIVDDSSRDRTKEVIVPYLQKDQRIKYICNEKNSGAAISRNKALRISKGRWIAFLDSDDLWAPDKLEKQVKFMEENDYYFSYTNYSECNEDGVLKGNLITGPKKITKAGMFAFCWPGCLTVMYDASVVGLIQIEDIKKNNDYAMWLKVCQKADCYLLDENLATYRRGRAGSISSHGIGKLMKWHYKLFREAEHMSPVFSFVLTCVNMLCGLYKKKVYVKNI